MKRMKCQICNGSLKFQEGVYVCENCGAIQTISAFFENTEVFLCYIENDMQGRRSRDSVIAQDLYNKLESAQIHTFYQRISAADLTESDFEAVNSIAFDSARVIVVIATTAEKFQMLIEKYGEKFAEKRVIPVYADMNANDIPKELKHLQAVNYNAVGASVDFVKNVSRILGKEQEVDITATAKKHMSRKKRTVFVSVFVILALMLSAASYVVFGTPYVLKSKKYEYAESLTAQGNYLEAIDIYSNLSDYKNSKNLLWQLYSRYNGYYNNQDNTLNLYINISENLSAEIQVISVNESGEIVRFETETIGTKNMFSFSFQDSQNNQGTGSIELLNDGIKFIITTQTKETDLFINDQNISFTLSQKTDAPVFNQITKNMLLSWLEKKMTINELSRRGYETQIEQEAYEDSRPTFRIVNTDIILAADYNGVIKGITAPAYIVLPDNIGMKAKPYLENEVLYIPEAKLRVDALESLYDDSRRYIFENTFTSTINDSTYIGMISKSALTDENWNQRVMNAAALEVDKVAVKEYPEEYNKYEICDVQTENETHYLCYLNLRHGNFENGNKAFYTVDKNFENVQFIAEVPCTSLYHVDISQYPELFGEFIGYEV